MPYFNFDLEVLSRIRRSIQLHSNVVHYDIGESPNLDEINTIEPCVEPAKVGVIPDTPSLGFEEGTAF